MAEYIEREALLEKANELASGSFSTPLIISAIEKAPKADVVEVVRCKDFQYIHLIGKTPFAVFVCTHNKGLGDNVRENDYCSYGKRKEGVEE